MSSVRKRTLLRLTVVAPAVCVLAGAAFVGAWATTKKKTPAAAAAPTLVAATVGTMSQTVSASGTIAPAATKDLNFTSAGKVTAVNVKAGQKVTKGQVLATIDSAALQSDVVRAQAQVAADESTLSTDESGSASDAQITSDQANLSAAQAQLASANTALAGAALVSPMTGKVTSVNLTVGEQLGSNGSSASSLSGNNSPSGTVSGATAEIEIVSTTLVVNLSVDDTEIAEIKAGQSATVTASSSSASSGANSPGGFSFGGPPGAATSSQSGATPNGATSNSATPGAATPNTSTSGPTTAKVISVGAIASASSGVATFPVVVRVTGPATGLYSGATAEVSITYKQLTNVIQVPTLAVTQTNGQSYVTVSANGTTTKRAITTGITSAGEVQITSGLKAGEQVVVTIPTATSKRGTNSGSGNGNTPTGQFFQGNGPPTGFKGPGQ